jgi:hypothetical protein
MRPRGKPSRASLGGAQDRRADVEDIAEDASPRRCRGVEGRKDSLEFGASVTDPDASTLAGSLGFLREEFSVSDRQWPADVTVEIGPSHVASCHEFEEHRGGDRYSGLHGCLHGEDREGQ